MERSTETPELLMLTADIVAAFVSNNSLRPNDLPKLIADTHAALAGAAAPAAPTGPSAEFPPAVSARKSLGRRDVIISMIDGKPYKTLRRHLSSRGLTPEQYRERYGLPASYPMVAPAYSEARRETAKRLGLGRKRKEPPRSAAKPAAAKAPARRGRKPRSA